MTSIIKKQAIRGVIWSAIERFSVQGIQFILSIIIARFVLPSEYGLIAMLSIFLAIAQTFVDSGFSNALIQKKNRTKEDFSTVFYFNIVIALVIYSLFYLFAPSIASFYEEPKLTSVSRWIGLSLIINGFSIVQRAKLTIALNFKMQAKASLIAVFLSGIVGVYLAYMGYGVWALVSQSLINSFINAILLWFFANWMPQWCFSWNSFRSLFSFGSKLLLSGLMHTVYTNLYSLVIGKKYSAMDVGLYNRANHFALFPSSNIVSVITRAIYPVQCQIQDDDEKLNASFIQYLRMTCLFVFPLMVMIAALSDPLIRFLLTDKWLPSAELLSILAFAYMWCPVMMINNQILNVKGRSDYFLKAEIVKKVMVFLILFAILPFGVKILCWGVVLYNFVDMAIIIYFVKKVVRTSYLEQIRNLFPLFSISILMGIMVFGIIDYVAVSLYFKLVIGLVVAIGLYVALGLLFHIKEFYMGIILLKSKFKFK